VKKELANPKAKIKIHEGSVRSQFKNHLGRYPLGSKSQRDIKKTTSGPKGRNLIFLQIGKSKFQNHLGRYRLVGTSKWQHAVGLEKPFGTEIIFPPLGGSPKGTQRGGTWHPRRPKTIDFGGSKFLGAERKTP
jgi:hypothetical protein